MREEIKNRTITKDGAIVSDPDRKYVRGKNLETMANTEDREQRDRIGRKEALIGQHGERKYDELVRKTGGRILEKTKPYRIRG